MERDSDVKIQWNYALIDGFAQILNVLHEVNSAVRQPLRRLSMREDTDKL
jgi:hypothetical protein